MILTENLELIDTLWNVNFFEVSNLEGGQTGINRYIMECKFCVICQEKIRGGGINRYIMECK